MKLYSFFNSSTSYRVRIALALKGLPYDYQGVNLREGQQYSPAHRTLSPIGGVPVLEVDGAVLSQSLAIIDYLDGQYPAPGLIPVDARQRARVLEIANLIGCDIHPVNNVRVLNYLQNVLAVSAEQKTAWYRHWVAEGLSAVEALLQRHGSGNYCVGDEPGLAECCLIPQVANAERMGCDLSGYPRIMAVYRHCLQLPAFLAAAPARQTDFIA
ncbi:maleylacetoacetate isomerase [Pseudomonas sp. GM55]|jgi:maleylacetoacetate isomerase/maleylpyruvate isomerase|uniref:maleylacetoacetate isomerase n=1 Tax=Pseudomonas sp. GM55 TaxID=1144333 RepID=UPI000270CD6D|nr:maleylacetoacetate isomerase [Pseudomonas sp. GM55]EJM75965.1 maleylacetoacetate isomerase [Pseudomonas sp. GM55]